MITQAYTDYSVRAAMAERGIPAPGQPDSARLLRKAEHQRLLKTPEKRAHVQVLVNRTAYPDNSAAREAASRFALALGEFEGFVDTSWDVLPGGVLLGVVAWRDTEALERFRHSELYAKFRLSPVSLGFVDRDFTLSQRGGAGVRNVVAAIRASKLTGGRRPAKAQAPVSRPGARSTGAGAGAPVAV